jgi:hypothetical protein
MGGQGTYGSGTQSGMGGDSYGSNTGTGGGRGQVRPQLAS